MKKIISFILTSIMTVVCIGITHTVNAADRNDILVAYFSATGTTENVAKSIQKVLGSDIYEIEPAIPYTSADLNYNSDCRANREQNDDSARPAISGSIENIDQYEVIFLGYPIWWGKSPKIIYTFLESYDLSGKIIIPFCTSGGSGISTSVSEIKALEPDANIKEGRRFTSSSESTVKQWTDGLNLPNPEPAPTPNVSDTTPEIKIENNIITVTYAPDNSTLILAFYKNNVLVNVDITKGSGTITNNVEGKSSDADTIKAFLWDMETIKPIMPMLGINKQLTSPAEEEPNVSKFNLSSGENGKAPKVTLNSGYTMPVAGIGTYSLHNNTCVNAVKSALEQGVRLIDTASAYGNEAEVGQAVREFIEESGVKREEIFVITKLYPGSDFSNPEAAIETALNNLNIGYIDMMLLHHPGTNDVKAYKVIEKYIADGKIHTAGLSNWYIEEIDDFIAQISIKPDLVQNEIHPYYQEQKVIPYMHNLGIAVQAWYPLGGRGHTSELLNNETIVSIANAHGKSAAQVILRWDLQNGVIVIPGSSNPDHIKENISLFDFELTDEEMAKIAALDRNEKHDWY